MIRLRIFLLKDGKFAFDKVSFVDIFSEAFTLYNKQFQQFMSPVKCL